MFVKRRNIFLGILIFLLLILVFKTFQSNEVATIVVGILSIVFLLLYLSTGSEVKLVIEKNRISRRTSIKNLRDNFVVFLELTNLATYSQFYDISLSDKIFDQVYREAVKKIGRKNVFLYRTDQLVFILDFKNKMVINQALRQEEQYKNVLQIISHLSNMKYRFNGIEEDFDIKIVAGCASIGIRDDIESIESLVKLAHFSMLKAKESKLEIVVADNDIHILKQDLDSFNQEIEKGFELDEFSPYFLPIIELKTNKIIGCESLVRWQKNKYRVIEASKFKDIADEKNLFEKIDKRVIEKTLNNYSKWLKEGIIDKNFNITINLSLKSLLTFKTYELINLVSTYNVKPQNVEFDISENDISSLVALQAIINLKKAKFKVSVDAFESNSFSLPSIMEMELDTIKIDRSQMPDKGVGTREYLFYKTVTNFSKEIKLKVMSKGIENENHFKLAKELNVDYVQGYYFTPPLDEINILKYLKEYKDGILTLG